MEQIKATAVLITREDRWPLSTLDPFDETIIEGNCPSVWRRFEIAATAFHDDIFVQDDDVQIDVERLWHVYQRIGRSMIVNAITAGHKKIYADTGMTLIGFGAFFPRRLAVDFVADRAKWVSLFGDHLVNTECDRMFTHTYQPHHSVVMPIREWRRPGAMSDRPEHYHVRDQIIKILKEMKG